ncbi:MAG TPA: SIMPL domain-containing protein [Gemmataceae bacterium]|jgi:uncharacterized protein YggE|nr:SIMPL domain-containing protein [Gemmataceae bacterium]
MKHLSIAVSLVILASVAAVPAPALGDNPPEGTVTGQGVVELKRRPEWLRIEVDVVAKGKDLKEALAKLNERRKAAQARLEKLGAVKSSIEWGEPALSPEKTDRQRRLEMMVSSRLRSRQKKGAQKPKQAPPAVVSVSLKADVPLKTADGDELLVLAQSLQEKVRAADLGGTKELQQVSPQEEELSEEAQEQDMGAEENEPKRGEPVFFFVRRISRQEQDKAMSEAFDKARGEAARLARAAGASLGSLRHLEPAAIDGSDVDESASRFSDSASYQILRRLRSGQPAVATDGNAEAIGIRPGRVTFRVAIAASFTLKKPAGR